MKKILECSSYRLLNANFDILVPGGHSSCKRECCSSSVRLKTSQWQNRYLTIKLGSLVTQSVK